MTVTARTIISKAMQKVGIITKNEDPSSDEANDALDSLNSMLSSWSTDYMLIYVRARESFPVTAGVYKYTIGTGQTFNTLRPTFINYATIHGSDNIEFTVDTIDDENYASISDKEFSRGRPYWLNYDNGYPVGAIRLYPTPDQSYTLFLMSEKVLSSFTLDSTVDLPPGWEDALVYNLAVRIAPEYGQEASEGIVALAKETKGAIRDSVLRNRTMDCQPGDLGIPNFYSGYFYGGVY